MYKLVGIILLCMLAASCSRKNTFPDDARGPRGYIACQTSCVSVQLLPVQVAGLNYRCDDLVYSYTDAEGVAYCPDGSRIEFLLATRDPNSDIAVSLGFYKLPDYPTPSYPLVRILPTELKDSAGNTVSATAANNITRLLLSLSVPETGTIVTTAPVNSVRLDSDDTDNVDSGTHVQTAVERAYPSASPSFGAFGSDAAFTGAYQPLLDALIDPDVNLSGHFVSTEAASAVIQQATKLKMTGKYFAELPAANINEGFWAEDAVNNQVNVSRIHVLVNRDNEAIGYGTNWNAIKTNDQTIYNLATKVPYQKMRPVGANATFDPETNVVNSVGYRWDIIDAIDNHSDLGNVEVTQGKLLMLQRFPKMVGNDTGYRLYVNKPNDMSVNAIPSEIGKWNGSYGSANYSGGTASIYRYMNNVSGYLDPDIWKIKDTVNIGQAYVFPLHIRVTFLYGSNQTIPFSTTQNTLGLTLLENGNIITDLNQDCSAVTGSYVDGIGQQEYRAGLVRAAGIRGTNDKYVSISLLFSGEAFGALDGMEVGTDEPGLVFDADAFRLGLAHLNIAGVLNAISGNGSVSSYGQVENGLIANANWQNLYNASLTFVYKDDGSKKDTAGASVPTSTPEQKLALQRITGTLRAELTPCYERKLKAS